MKRLTASSLCVVVAVRLASAASTPIPCNIFFDGTNTVQIAWNVYPGESYVLQTTTNLAQPWQTGGTLTTTSNSIYQSFPITIARFFKVVKLDTGGPEVYKTSPFDGAIGINPKASIQAWLRDETGVNTNSISLTVGTNSPVALNDPRLAYASGMLVYTPSTNQFLGTNGQIVTISLSAADTLGNQTANFTWSFQLELAPVVSANLVLLSGTNSPCNLTLISTGGDIFTFTYAGSCCLTNGMQLVDTNLYTGYTRTVVGFTNYPSSSTVVALTRPTMLAELLQAGSLSSANFTLLTNSLGRGPHPNDLELNAGFPLQYTFNLGQILYEDANVLVETTPNSVLNLDAAIQLTANFHWFKLTALQAQLTGTASFELAVHALASASKTLANSVPLITPMHNIYGAMIGPVPVWVDVVFEVNVGYSADFGASADVTEGMSALKSISVGKKWDSANGWGDIYDNPAMDLAFSAPTWQIQGSADLRAYLQPKVSVLIYSAAGVTADLEPYLELAGSAQLSPPQWDLSLYAGLDSTIGLDLSVWDDTLGDLPTVLLHLIPREALWHDAGPSASVTPAEITQQPQSQSATAGSTVSFFVQARGTAPLTYRWYKNGLLLGDDPRINGTGSSTLRIANVQNSDAANYRVRVSNQAGQESSDSLSLTVLLPPPSGTCLLGDWVSHGTAGNFWHMVVQWSDANQRFEGYLTVQGELSAWVGFSVGELVWTATPTSDPRIWTEGQKYRTGSNGQSTGFSWQQQGPFALDGCTNLPPQLTTTQDQFSEPGFPVPSDVACVAGEWECSDPNNRWQMRVNWSASDQAFEGRLTAQGNGSAWVGFSLGEVVWTATPTSDPRIWTEGQKYRTGSNGQSTGFSWQQGTFTISACTNSPVTLTGTQAPFVKVGP